MKRGKTIKVQKFHFERPKGYLMDKTKDVSVIQDINGNSIVVIHDIKFKGKRSVNWNDVEAYLLQYVGESYTIAGTNDVIYFGTDLPDEYAHSQYTGLLKGGNAKAKANAAQGLGKMIEIASNGVFTSNRKTKHSIDGANGWYRYESRFALPVYCESGKVERYNVFHVYIIIRHDLNGKKYLYDIINIKKETSTPPSC